MSRGGGFRDEGTTVDEATSIATTQAQSAIAAALALPAWQALPLAAGWAPIGSAFSAPYFLVDALGFGHLRGHVVGAGSLVGVLPAGSRPDGTVQVYSCIGNDAPARVDVANNGNVSLIVGSGTSYLSFGHLVWRVGG